MQYITVDILALVLVSFRSEERGGICSRILVYFTPLLIQSKAVVCNGFSPDLSFVRSQFALFSSFFFNISFMRKRTSSDLFFAAGTYFCITKAQKITCINRASARTPGFLPSGLTSPIPLAGSLGVTSSCFLRGGKSWVPAWDGSRVGPPSSTQHC